MCTSILVGSEVTADGSYIITRSADHASRSPQHFIIHPAVSGQKRIHSTAACGGVNHFSWPMPENTLRYTSFPNWKTHLHGGEGFNEAGFGMTATESIFAKPEVLAVDPYNEESGITEDDIPDVILPQCRTAIEGVKLLGHIVEEVGAGEGFGVAFVDKDGIWWFETGSGHQWIAQKLPQDKYYTTGNQGRLQDYDPDSSDMMASPTLVSFAQEHGFYKPETDGAFNFSKVYTRNDERDRIYNDPRVWQIQKRFNPSLVQDPHDGRNFPVYLKPEAKISLSDIRSIMRDHYEGTEHDPYTNGLNGKERWRPISVFRTYETHIMHVRPWLPKEIGEVVYLALGMADLSVFVPFYAGLEKEPMSYQVGTADADSFSAFWKFKRLQTLAMQDYATLAPIVKKAFSQFEQSCDKAQVEMEAAYLKAESREAAQALLNAFNHKVIADAQTLAESLMNECFTVLTEKVEAIVPFRNGKHVD